MKAFIVGLFTAILATVGLVAVTSTTPASASCTQYVCINTSTNARATPKVIKQGKQGKVKVGVSVRGNVDARGDLTIKVNGPGGYNKTFRVAFNGDARTVNLGKLTKPGKYAIKAQFRGDDGFRDSSDSATITVKKKKK